MSKILFIDVDGTLCGSGNKAPESAVRAIRQARANGHRVYICTGRSKAEVYDDIWSIGLDGMIGGNGSYIEDHGEIVMHQKISLEDVKALVAWFRENDIEFYLEANSGLYPSEGYRQKCLDRYQAGGQRSLNMEGVLKFLDGMTYGHDFDKDDVNKISYCLNSDEDFERTKEKFPHLKHGTWGVGGPMKHGDVGVTGIDKKYSVQKLLDHLGCQKEDAIAFGDEAVDIPMFEAAGYAVAMGSGTAECKAAADYVTTGVDEDGLWNAFQYLNLI